MAKRQHIMIIDHIRKLWLSIERSSIDVDLHPAKCFFGGAGVAPW